MASDGRCSCSEASCAIRADVPVPTAPFLGSRVIERIELETVELPPEIEIPPPPEKVARPATPVIADVAIDDKEARETLRITRGTCENLFDFAFDLARKRKDRGGKGQVTCVDKANTTSWFATSIDFLNGDTGVVEGDIVKVRVVHADEYDLWAEQ